LATNSKLGKKVDLLQQIFTADREKNSPSSDQGFKPYFANMKSDIPDRTAFLTGKPGAEDPVPKMKEGIDELAKVGVTHFVMPCNTAHVFLPRVEAHIAQKGYAMSAVHIVDATMAEVDKRAAGARKVAVMATDGTLGSELYQKRGDQYRQANGQARVEWLVPSGSQTDIASDQGKVMHAIYGCVKNAGGPPDRMKTAEMLFAEVARKLADDGADAILLACTEIPLGLKGPTIQATDGRAVPLISTTQALATAFVQTAQEGGVPVAASPATLVASARSVESRVPHGS
jgi:aspartate racemase